MEARLAVTFGSPMITSSSLTCSINHNTVRRLAL